MNNSIIITCAISALITWIFMYIDSRLFNTPKTKLTYIKNMAFVAAIGGSIVYFMGGGIQTGAGLPMNHIGINTSYLGEEQVFTGVPNF